MSSQLEPKVLTQDQVRDVVGQTAFDKFIGVLESEFLEFKSEPYRLAEDMQKLELAKDVSAFANTRGGFIILGVKSTKIPEYNADVAFELNPIPRDRFNQEQYEDVVRDWIYPHIKGLRFSFIQPAGSVDKGFVVLEIPPDSIASRPFLIVRGTDSNIRKERRITFGYIERFQSTNLPTVVHRLQQLLHLGIKFEGYDLFQQGVDAQLGELRTSMQRLTGAVLRQVSTDELNLQTEREQRFEGNVEDAAKETEMSERPRLILGAVPDQALKLSSFFSSQEDPLVRAFENPPELRANGFDFNVGRPSEILRGSIRRIAISGYKSMQLSTDGELIVLVPGDDDFLAWASMGKPGSAISINSFVLAEATYTFTLYVKNIYQYAIPRPSSVRLYIGFDDMSVDGKPATLSPHESGPFIATSEQWRKKAPSSRILLSVEVQFGQTAERMAFLLRAALYHWFGFDDSSIPYTREADEGTVVDKKSLFKPLAKGV